MLTQERVKELFDYRDGSLYRRYSSGNQRKGSRFGTVGYSSGRPYRWGSVDGKHCIREHRIIFLMFHGYLPEFIDHIDGNGLNNTIENLREASRSENSYNRSKRKDNKSGHTGVFWHAKAKKWSVEIQANKTKKYLGLFEDFELACLVSDEARDKYHGEFSSLKGAQSVL